MPPKRKSRARDTTKHKIQKAPIKVKAVSRATRVQNQGDQVATPPGLHGRPRSRQLTQAQVSLALDGLDLCIQPTSLPRVDATSTGDALWALDIDMDIMDPPMNSGVPAPRMSNPGRSNEAPSPGTEARHWAEQPLWVAEHHASE